jgi:DNA-3-methyladenine glycosylase
MHTHCLVNVVSGGEGIPHAILIRAVDPHIGIGLMYERRQVKMEKQLTSGPGKLTKALGITMEDYGRVFYEPPLFIAEGYVPVSISNGPRIGIDHTGEARQYLYRFWVTDNPFVSR